MSVMAILTTRARKADCSMCDGFPILYQWHKRLHSSVGLKWKVKVVFSTDVNYFGGEEKITRTPIQSEKRLLITEILKRHVVLASSNTSQNVR